MRRLIHVPIVHDEADLGMAGPALLAETVRLAGTARWTAHTETLCCYWAEVAVFLQSLDARQLKLYQDGLPAGGLVGRAIVEEAARRGSRNYQLLLDLIGRGAARITEDGAPVAGTRPPGTETSPQPGAASRASTARCRSNVAASSESGRVHCANHRCHAQGGGSASCSLAQSAGHHAWRQTLPLSRSKIRGS